MKQTIIFVEDGSVDVEKLQEAVGDNVPVIVYRAGAEKPQFCDVDISSGIANRNKFYKDAVKRGERRVLTDWYNAVLNSAGQAGADLFKKKVLETYQIDLDEDSTESKATDK